MVPEGVIESLLQPINGIQELLNSDDPEEIAAQHLLKVCSAKPCHRNRKQLRDVIANTKSAFHSQNQHASKVP